MRLDALRLLAPLALFVLVLGASVPAEKNDQKSGAKSSEKSAAKAKKPAAKAGDKTADPAKKGSAKNGAAIFKEKCAVCHALTGAGDTGIGKRLKIKDLRADDVQKMSDSQLFDLIAQGKGQMPPYERTLGHEKIHDVVAYLRELGKKK